MVDGYLIAVEYVNARLASRLRLSELGPDDLARAAQASLPGTAQVAAGTPAGPTPAPAPAGPDDEEARP